MPRIYVEFAGLEQIGTGCKTAASRVDTIETEFWRTIQKLDWDVRYEADINSTAKQISQKLEKQIAVLKNYQEFLNNTIETYRLLNDGDYNREMLSDLLQAQAEASVKFDKSIQDKNSNSQFEEWIKSILEWLDKTNSNEYAGITKDGLSYLEALYDYFTGDMKGLTGAEDWFDLCENSADLWKGLYDYLKEYYNKTGSLFSITNQKKVAGVDIAGNIAGFISSIFGAVDTISSENMGASGVISQILGTGDEAADIWKSVMKFIQTGTSVEKVGVYSAVDIYTSVIKSGFMAVSQAFDSVDKYSADGSWDLGDTGATGIDSAMAGLYGISHTLTFGADDLVFGFIDNLTGGNGNQDMSYFEKAAEGYKILADELGKKIGNLWIDLFG